MITQQTEKFKYFLDNTKEYRVPYTIKLDENSRLMLNFYAIIGYFNLKEYFSKHPMMKKLLTEYSLIYIYRILTVVN